jgi:hypothetical protein
MAAPRSQPRRRPRVVRTSPSDAAGPPSPALRLQIIQMEQASLLGQRSLTWSEAFSRSSMFLTTLSGAIIAIALAAQASSFGRGFLAFAIIILSVTLFVGLATLIRLIDVNNEDLLWVQGLNRLRHAYLELADDLEQYMVSAWHDDDAGVLISLGASPSVRPMLHHVFVTTPAVVATIDAVLAGTIVGIAALLVDIPREWGAALAAGMFSIAGAAIIRYQLRSVGNGRKRSAVRFPSPLRETADPTRERSR